MVVLTVSTGSFENWFGLDDKLCTGLELVVVASTIFVADARMGDYW